MAEYKGDRVGQQLGPYRLTRLLGAGGFGEVYEADHQLLQQKRAIKLLLERHFHDPKQRERFLREARTLATLEHPNILPVLEVGEVGTVLYLVMPFYRRGTLNDLLKQRSTPLPLAEVESLLAQMCAAVGYAHARHIAHLDLKPDNMLLHQDGKLVLSDFGLAHLIKQGRLEAGSSANWGTPFYMAPEQIRGEPEVRSDLYALGVILYQLLTNQRPFTGNAPEAVMMKHLLEAPPPLRAVSPAASAALEAVLHKALEKQPEARYPTAEALLTDFRAAVSSPSPRPAQSSVFRESPAAPTPPMNGPAPVVQPPTLPIPREPAPHAAGPANITKATAVLCEIELKNGHSCAIPPIGRCSTCGRAFCASHQARTNIGGYGWVPLVNMCAPCLEVENAEEAKRVAEAGAPHEYFESGAARSALLASGVNPVKIYSVNRRWKDSFFFFGSKEVKEVTPIGRGWILGKFRWHYNRNRWGYGESDYVHEDCLTAIMDLSPDDPIFDCGFPSNFHVYSRYNSTLVRVQPYSGGYELLGLGAYDRFEQGWREAMQAVKRLVGESS